MKPTLYGIFPYDRGGKVRWLMHELKLEYQDHWLNAEKNEIESESYLRVNPLGRIPAIEVEGRAMFESGAICAYLADRYLDRGLAPALTAPERMDYQQWMYFAAATVDPFQTRIMIIEDIPAGEVLKAKQEALFSEVKDGLELLNRILAKQDFLVANRFSAADICVGYHLYFLRLWPELKVYIDAPHVTAYLDRLEKRPSAIAAKVFSYEE